ncbi:hypothetical protein D0Z08_04755 [Nocardioides immobilis]|uniref:Uncharacterized protein n=2 Tax=Nocardioides immobilis TaxID=2049295 RepID=A0A417Y6H6_9ACTN|nr:hypothetical protein D0Z08_04755 [Nocardioides immobilis]
MSVGDQLGIEENSELLDLASERWAAWVVADARLGVVDRFDDLRGWLPTVERESADEVLLALAMLAAPDGGDDVAAAAALAKCLLPGACNLAGWFLSLPPRGWAPRDSQPVVDGPGSLSTRINELVASQLWIEVRTFPWRRLTKVAANILMNTKVGVLREVGDYFQVARSDRTWANTTLIEAFSYGDRPTLSASEWSGDDHPPTERVAAAAFHRPLLLAVESGEVATEPSADVELLELLTWACDTEVISRADRHLLLCLVDEASRVEIRNTGRGYGGLLATEVSIRVAPRVGKSEATVRRHAARSMRALAAAAPGKFGHEE